KAGIEKIANTVKWIFQKFSKFLSQFFYSPKEEALPKKQKHNVNARRQSENPLDPIWNRFSLQLKEADLNALMDDPRITHEMKENAYVAVALESRKKCCRIGQTLIRWINGDAREHMILDGKRLVTESRYARELF